MDGIMDNVKYMKDTNCHWTWYM